VHLVGFIIRIYEHDARSPERQIHVQLDYTLNYNSIPQMNPSLEIDGQMNGLLNSDRIL